MFKGNKTIIKSIKKFFHNYKYTYGKTINPKTGVVHGEHRRINHVTGKLEMLLWKAGEQGHTEDVWCKCGSGWISWFVPNDKID